ATIVAGGIKVALITTAAGLVIAIPINIMHNYFVARIDRMVIDMEESAQRTLDHLHVREMGRATTVCFDRLRARHWCGPPDQPGAPHCSYPTVVPPACSAIPVVR